MPGNSDYNSCVWIVVINSADIIITCTWSVVRCLMYHVSRQVGCALTVISGRLSVSLLVVEGNRGWGKAPSCVCPSVEFTALVIFETGSLTWLAARFTMCLSCFNPYWSKYGQHRGRIFSQFGTSYGLYVKPTYLTD